MQKEKEQQKPREELTLVFFPSSSLMLHSEGGREGGCKTEKWEKKSGRRGRREEGSHPPPFTSCTSDSHLVRRFLCTQCLVSFSFVSFTHSLILPLLSFHPFLFSSGYVSHTSPLCFTSIYSSYSFPCDFLPLFHLPPMTGRPPLSSPLFVFSLSPSCYSSLWKISILHHFPFSSSSLWFSAFLHLLCPLSSPPTPALFHSLPPSYSFPGCCCPPPSSSLLSPPLPGSLRVPGLVKQCPHSPDINHRVPPIWATVCMWKRNMYAVNLKANVSLHSLTFKKESTCSDPRKARAKFVLMHT